MMMDPYPVWGVISAMWARLDDGYFDHPKIAQASQNAISLHVASIVYAAQQLTDGFIAEGVVPLVAVKAKIAPDQIGAAVAALLTIPPGYGAGLWETADGGYAVHDFLEYNPSRAQVLTQREATRKRVSDLRGRRRGTSIELVSDDQGEIEGDVTALQPRLYGVSNTSPVPAPPTSTRPNPSHTQKQQRGAPQSNGVTNGVTIMPLSAADAGLEDDPPGATANGSALALPGLAPAPIVKAAKLAPAGPDGASIRPYWDAFDVIFNTAGMTLQGNARGRRLAACMECWRNNYAPEALIQAATNWPRVMHGATMTETGIANNALALTRGPQVNGALDKAAAATARTTGRRDPAGAARRAVAKIKAGEAAPATAPNTSGQGPAHAR